MQKLTSTINDQITTTGGMDIPDGAVLCVSLTGLNTCASDGDYQNYNCEIFASQSALDNGKKAILIEGIHLSNTPMQDKNVWPGKQKVGDFTYETAMVSGRSELTTNSGSSLMGLIKPQIAAALVIDVIKMT